MSLAKTVPSVDIFIQALSSLLEEQTKPDLGTSKKEKGSLISSLDSVMNVSSDVLVDIERQMFFFDEEVTYSYAPRKGLISDAEVEINSIAQSLHLPGLSQKAYETTVYEVLPYVLKPEVSHIALRHLACGLSSNHGNIFAFTFYSPGFTEHLVQWFIIASSYLEWSSLDEILSAVFAEDRWGFNDFTRPDVVDRIWSKALEQALRFCNKLPETLHHLKQQIDVNRNLGNGTLRSLATYPTLLLRAAHSKHDGRFNVIDHIGRPRLTPDMPCLASLRQYLSSDPDVILSAILRERETTSIGDGYHFIDKVANSHELRRLCQALALLLLSEDECVRSRVMIHLGFIASLDRYCSRTMTHVVEGISKQIPEQRLGSIRSAIREGILRPRKVSEAGLTTAWVYRHKSLDHGCTHVRHGLAFSRRHPCETCVALGIWEEWINSSDASCEGLIAKDNQLLWLYPEPGRPFKVEDHIPIYCGVNERGEPEFIGGAGVMHEDYFVPAFSRTATCTVTEGACKVEYEDGGSIKSTAHYRVLVLRYDSSGGPASNDIEECEYFPGLDFTGPIYWQEAWIDDDGSDDGSDVSSVVDFNEDEFEGRTY